MGKGRRAVIRQGEPSTPAARVQHPHSQLTSAPARGEAAEDDHAHVQPLLDPDLAHDANHLQGQHVLAKVVPALDEESDQSSSSSPPLAPRCPERHDDRGLLPSFPTSPLGSHRVK